MLRFTRKKRQHISSRLAIFASLMLLVSSLAGMTQSLPGNGNGSIQHANNSFSAEQVAESNAHTKSLNRNKGFKVSLLLFRLD